MLKLIIADREVSNIQGIKYYIESNFYYINIEKTFYSENDFHNYFQKNIEYILIIDLRFFSGDFYKKIKDFQTTFPKIKIIIYGKIEDIDYMKKLEQELNIIYTLRPVKPTNLKKSIETILYNIQKEKNFSEYETHIEQLYINNFNIFKDTFLRTLISGKINSEDEIKTGFEYFNIKLCDKFVVAIVRIDSFRKVIQNLDERKKHLLTLKLLDIINKNIFSGIAFINSFNEIVIIFNSIEDITNILKEIKIKANTELDLNISIGVGRVYDEIKDVKTSFNEANISLKHRFNIGGNSIIFIEQIEPKNTYIASYPLDREQILIYSAVIGEYEYCLKILDEIFQFLRNYKNVYEKIISQFIMHLIISINRVYAEKGSRNENVNKFFDTNSILNLKDLDSAYNFLKLGLKSLCEYTLQQRKVYEDELYQNIVDYINKNYFMPINPQHISENLNCNFEYLKNIFEIKSKSNIYDYLHKVRIEQAKKLIMTTNLKDDSIAANIGYDNVTTFRKMFRNIEGCLAGDFRAIHRDK